MDERGSFSFINFGKSETQEHTPERQKEIERDMRRKASILGAREVREKSLDQEKNIEISDVIIERNTGGSMQGTLYVKNSGTEDGFSLVWSFEPKSKEEVDVIFYPAHDSHDENIQDFIEKHQKQLVDGLLEQLPL